MAERRRSHQHQAALCLGRSKHQATPADPPHHPPLARVDNHRCLARAGRSCHDKQSSRPDPLHWPGPFPWGIRAGQADTPQRTPTAQVEQLHAAARIISDRHKPPVWRELVVPDALCSLWVVRERPAAETSARGARADPRRSPRRGERVPLHAALRRRPQVATAPQGPRRQRQAQPLRKSRPSHDLYGRRHATSPLSPVPPQRSYKSFATPALRETTAGPNGSADYRFPCKRQRPRPSPAAHEPRRGRAHRRLRLPGSEVAGMCALSPRARSGAGWATIAAGFDPKSPHFVQALVLVCRVGEIAPGRRSNSHV